MHNRFIIDDVVYWINDSYGYEYNSKGEVPSNNSTPIRNGVVISVSITKIPSGIYTSYKIEETILPNEKNYIAIPVAEKSESRLFASEQEAKDYLTHLWTRNYELLIRGLNG